MAAGGRLQARAVATLRHSLQPAVCHHEHARAAFWQHPPEQGQFRRVHAPAQGRLPEREPPDGDVPNAPERGLAGIPLRLRLQPDAGHARCARFRTKTAAARPPESRCHRDLDPRCGPLLRLHGRAGQQLRRGPGGRSSQQESRVRHEGGLMSASQPWTRWILLLLAVLGLWAAYWQWDLGHWLTLERLKASRDSLASLYSDRPVQTALAFFGVYVLATALSFPGAAILTLAAGAMFGWALGLLLVSFASSVGALLAFWVSRYMLRDFVRQRFGRLLQPINEGLAKDGTFYLLTLRLVPVFPFWLINLLMGLTTLGARKFY